MKFSENKHYLEYMKAFADGKHEAARVALEKCLINFGHTTYQRAFLLQRFGEIAFLKGQEEESIRYFQAAEEADSTSLQPRYMFAEFLGRKLKRFDDAIRKCDEVLLSAKTSPFEETEEEFGSDYYIAKANDLKVFCETERRARSDL